MKRLSRTLWLAFGTTLGAYIAVRLLSRQKSLPCPAAISWVLDNPLSNRLAGADLLLDRAGVTAGMRVLDAGCGPGRLTVPTARRVAPEGTVVAVDLQEAMLNKARQRAAQAGQANIQFVHAGLGEGRLPVDSFDRAFLVTVLGEVPDRLAALKEIYQALKPGGVLSVTEIAFGDPHYQPRRTVRWLAQEAGFREVKAFETHWAYTLHFIKDLSENR